MNVGNPAPAEVSLARIEALLAVIYDQLIASRNLLETISTAIGAEADSKPSAWVENNSRGTTTGAKAYGQRLAEVVDDVARESKRLQVMASGSLAGVMRDDD